MYDTLPTRASILAAFLRSSGRVRLGSTSQVSADSAGWLARSEGGRGIAVSVTGSKVPHSLDGISTLHGSAHIYGAGTKQASLMVSQSGRLAIPHKVW